MRVQCNHLAVVPDQAPYFIQHPTFDCVVSTFPPRHRLDLLFVLWYIG